jgi:hypothetical protein
MHRGTTPADGSSDRDRTDRPSLDPSIATSALETGAPSTAEGAAVLRLGVPVAGALASSPTPHAVPVGAEGGGEQIPFYYSSKYARLDALPRALDYGKTECLASVRTYIEYVFDPPDGAGDPVENARHLRGACARLRTGARSDNAALLLLDAFSLLAIEASSPHPVPSDGLESERLAVRDAVRWYRTAYRRFMASEPWPELLSVLTVFSERLTELHPGLRPLLDGLHRECVLYRTVYLLRGVNRRLLDEPSA